MVKYVVYYPEVDLNMISIIIILKYQVINVDPFFNIKYSDVDAKATGVKNVHNFQITLAMVQIRVVVDMEGKTSMSWSFI